MLPIDGKSTPLRAWDGHYAQQQGARGMLGTLTASFVSSPGCPGEVEHLVELADRDGRVRYRVRITRELEGYLDWEHLRTVVHVRRERLSTSGGVTSVGDRYFVSSLSHESLSPKEWARLIRARWGVENNNHHTFDTILAEDERPGFQEHPAGGLNLTILRRIAYGRRSGARAGRTDRVWARGVRGLTIVCDTS